MSEVDRARRGALIGEAHPIQELSERIPDHEQRVVELAHDLTNAAYLRGDFVMSSGLRSSYYFEKYPLVIDAGFLIMVFLSMKAWGYVFTRAYYHSLVLRRKGIVERQRRLQYAYFKEGVVDRKTFYDMSTKFDTELEGVERELGKLEEKMKRK